MPTAVRQLVMIQKMKSDVCEQIRMIVFIYVSKRHPGLGRAEISLMSNTVLCEILKIDISDKIPTNFERNNYQAYVSALNELKVILKDYLNLYEEISGLVSEFCESKTKDHKVAIIIGLKERMRLLRDVSNDHKNEVNSLNFVGRRKEKPKISFQDLNIPLATVLFTIALFVGPLLYIHTFFRSLAINPTAFFSSTDYLSSSVIWVLVCFAVTFFYVAYHRIYLYTNQEKLAYFKFTPNMKVLLAVILLSIAEIYFFLVQYEPVVRPIEFVAMLIFILVLDEISYRFLSCFFKHEGLSYFLMITLLIFCTSLVIIGHLEARSAFDKKTTQHTVMVRDLKASETKSWDLLHSSSSFSFFIDTRTKEVHIVPSKSIVSISKKSQK